MRINYDELPTINASKIHKTSSYESEHFLSDNISVFDNNAIAADKAAEGLEKKGSGDIGRDTSVLEDVKKLVKQVMRLYSVQDQLKNVIDIAYNLAMQVDYLNK